MAYDLSLSLTGANGDTIQFDNSSYIITDGLKGFGIPATTVRIQESATDGGIFRHTKRGIREVDMPIVIVGTDRADTETKMRRLSNALQNTLGAATLTATYANGDVYYLNVYYAGGGETVFGQDGGLTFARWVVTLQAPNPFWTSTTGNTFKVNAGNTGRGLLPKLSYMRVSSSQAIGTVTVANTAGDVPSFPVYTIYGPLTTLSIATGSTGFTYNAAIAAGETITIDTAAGTVVDQAGVNKYANLGAAPKLFAIPPGTTTITVNGTGATSASQIACTYYPRREVLH